MQTAPASDQDRARNESGVVLSPASLRYQALGAEKARFNEKKLQSRRERHRLRLDQVMLRKYLRGPDVLDFPIGTGRLLDFTAEHYNLFGYDISSTFIERAKEAYPQIADHFEVHSMEQVDSPRCFNSIYSLRVTRHINDIPRAIGQISKILVPGGRWVFNIAPQHADFARLSNLFENEGMTIAKSVKYDVYSGLRHMNPWAARFYAQWLRLVELWPVPFAAYRLVDTMLLPFAHTVLVVAEKR